MLLPTGDSLSLAVELFCPTSAPPQRLAGELTRSTGEHVEIRLEEVADPPLGTGCRVIMTRPDDPDARMVGDVTAERENLLELDVRRQVSRDKREYPRMFGGVQLRYSVVGPADTQNLVPLWLAGVPGGLSERAWHEPDPFMDFSASGLRFEDQQRCCDGDLLLIELRVPTAAERWRGTARVVRVSPIPGAQAPTPGFWVGHPTHHVAVQFVGLPQDAVKALAEFTLKVQRSLMSHLRAVR